jgi:hypothetical protein
MQLRRVQTGAGRHDVGDQALVGLASAVLDDRDVGEPGEGLQGLCWLAGGRTITLA